MGRGLINLFLLALIAFVGWYFIAPNVLCWQEGGMWSFQSRVCSIGTFVVPGGELMPMMTHIPKVDFAKLKEIIINIPNTEGTTATLVRTNDTLGRFAATFTQEGTSVDGVAEALALLSVTDEVTGMSLVPFVVNFGGSGSFIYVGLFEHGTATLMHRDSVFVGDRISLDTVSFERAGDVLKAVVLYNDRKETDAMAAAPTLPKKLVSLIQAKTLGEPTIYDRTIEYVTSYKDFIKVESPAPLSTVNSPVIIRGIARGQWFFEASFPVSVVGLDDKEIGHGVAQADGEWMTTEFVPFTATVDFSKGTQKTGKIILKKDNPSGLPEHDDSFEIPVNF